MSSLFGEILAIPALDQHAHNVLKEECELPFEAAFTEATDPEVWRRDTPHGLFYRRSLKQLSSLYDCAPEAHAVLAARQRMSLAERSALCLRESNLKSLFLDDGLMPTQLKPLSWHEQFVPVRRLLRIEFLAEELLRRDISFDEFEGEFTQRLQSLSEKDVGLKSIAAYRGGLDVPQCGIEQARADYSRARLDPASLGSSPLYSFLFHRALEIAHDSSVPVQFHTGFGDPDLALELSNPLQLRPLIERYRCPFIVLHAGYPFVREAGFLSSVYSHVWVDFGLALPFLSVGGMLNCLRGLLELTPLNKLLYSSDASLIPELYYLGSLNARRVLADVLKECVDHGDLSLDEAREAARWILADNAERLYRC
jgi:predicted TIM-barrel fold metal-dependent hydrolase